MEYRLPKVGDKVNVIEKRNYENGKLTTGVVSRLLSNPKEVHPRGNKVELKDGTVGRMVSFVDEVGEQAFVDPAIRDQYTAEVRAERPPRQNNFPRPAPSGDRPARRDFGSDRRSGPGAMPEKPVTAADIPGEDDLR